MAVFPKIRSHSDAIDYFKELDHLAELPFYEQLSVIKTNQAFGG